jgi:RimJ/RimL family protein N-acetyltransferase
VPVTPEAARGVVDGNGPGLPTAPGWPHEDTVDALEMSLAPDAGPGWLITLDGAVIGDCGTFGWPDELGVVEIGYGLSAAFRGRGFATEAAEAMCAWLSTEAAAIEITATSVEKDNLPSRRVLEKLGFRQDGEDEHTVSYRRSAFS